MRWLIFSAILGFLIGCGQSDEPVVYEVPRESPEPPPAAAPPMMASTTGSNPMQGQSLPSESLHDQGDNPDWEVPEHWQQQAAGNMRRATFAVAFPEGALDVAVTSFPGDVGGDLANINRWRQQIGLAAVNASQLEDLLERFEVNGVPVAITELYGSESAMRAAIIPVGGNTWFVRMSGAPALVERDGEAFRSFVESIRF